MRRPAKPRYPQVLRITQALQAIENYIPVDEPIRHGWRESLRGTPNFRVSGETHQVPWMVDIYCGNFIHVSVGSAEQVCRSIPEAVGFIQMRLQIKDHD